MRRRRFWADYNPKAAKSLRFDPQDGDDMMDRDGRTLRFMRSGCGFRLWISDDGHLLTALYEVSDRDLARAGYTRIPR